MLFIKLSVMNPLDEFLEFFSSESTNVKNDTKPEHEEISFNYDIKVFSTHKLVRILNYIDLKLYKYIIPIDLINYSSSNGFISLQRKNKNLFNLVKNNKKYKKYFLKLAHKLLKNNNFNSFISVYNALKTFLTSKELEVFFEYDDVNYLRVEIYKHKEEYFIPPVKFFLNELSSYKEKSKNFYKVIDLYVKLQDMKLKKIKKKEVKKLEEILNEQKDTSDIVQKDNQFMFLLWLLE